MFEKEGIDVILLPHVIDTQFVQLVESKNENVKFLRVDSELADSMKGESSEEIASVLELFKSVVADGTEIRFEAIEDESLPAVLNVSEDSRRMEDMMRMYNMGGSMNIPQSATLILNSLSPIIRSLETKDPEKATVIAKQVYNLCLLTQGKLDESSLRTFLSDSYGILSMI